MSRPEKTADRAETARRPTRRERVEEMEEAIVSAAAAAFASDGFEGARIAGIAAAAGVAEGTVYLYFRNKQSLLAAVLRAFFARLTREATEAVDRIPETRGRLDFLARQHLREVSSAWRMFALMSYHARFSDDYRGTETCRLHRAYSEVFDRVVREGMTRGDIRGDLAPGLLRDMFYGGLEFACRSALMRDPAGEGIAARVTPGFLELFLAGAMPQSPGAETDDAGRLAQAAARLEAAAARLEQAARGADDDHERPGP